MGGRKFADSTYLYRRLETCRPTLDTAYPNQYIGSVSDQWNLRVLGFAAPLLNSSLRNWPLSSNVVELECCGTFNPVNALVKSLIQSMPKVHTAAD